MSHRGNDHFNETRMEAMQERKKKVAKKMPKSSSVSKYLNTSPKHLIKQLEHRPGESPYSRLKRLLDN